MKAVATISGAKIKMMQASLHCFILGLLGLLPIVGFPFAIAALWVSSRSRIQEKYFWNAARPYRLWGVVCAAFGAIFWGGVDTIVIYHAIYG